MPKEIADLNFQNQETNLIRKYLENSDQKNFIKINLEQSLGSIGFSEDFRSGLFKVLESPSAVDQFIKTHEKELHEIDDIKFYEQYVPEYFSKYVVKEIPDVGKIVDLGCGTGIMAKLLSQRKNTQIIGVDVMTYPDWGKYKSDNLDFRIVKEENFPEFIKKEKPEALALTWTLHHMSFPEQENYIKYLSENLRSGTILAILEDAYSEELEPENGKDINEAFMKWPIEARKEIMTVYDWIASRILTRRKSMPVTFSYRTLEQWQEAFEKLNFIIEKKKFIGFPEHRDINTPQSLLIAKKD